MFALESALTQIYKTAFHTYVQQNRTPSFKLAPVFHPHALSLLPPVGLKHTNPAL